MSPNRFQRDAIAGSYPHRVLLIFWIWLHLFFPVFVRSSCDLTERACTVFHAMSWALCLGRREVGGFCLR